MRNNDDAMSDELVDGEWTKLYHPSSSSNMPRRPSLSTAPNTKSRGNTSVGYNHDRLDSKSSDSSPYASSSYSSPLRSNFQQHSVPLPSRHRMSIFSVASDALGFRKKIGSVSRKKPTVDPLSHQNNVTSEVIEISNHTLASTTGSTAAHKDYEHEERERLRDAAAQSIGLDPELLHSSNFENQSFLDSPQSPSPAPIPMPSFPATLAALLPFTELSATLPKFTPPSSLLVYALAKQWKSRTITLTSHSPSRKTHVHLFKGASKDDKEVERLEVTEDSVIYVSEEHVGGRGNVVKFVGKDASPRQHGLSGESSLRTMWFLQIKDPTESHRWIAAIKNAVLTQRAVRAGVDVTAQLDGGNEPKGDMDVMLSMHLQRIVSSHPVKGSTATSPSSPLIQTPPSRPPSLRSLRINASPSLPTTLTKGIFSGTRPRSPSVEGSPTLTNPPGHANDSFSAAGTSLLTMLRSKSSADSSSLPSHLLPPPSHVPVQGSPPPSLRSINTPVIIAASDLKISKERDAPEVPTFIPEASSCSTTPGASTPPAPAFPPLGPLTISLQPPPRKNKHVVAAIPTTTTQERQGMYKQVSGNRSVAGNFGIPSRNTGEITPRDTPPASPNVSNFSGAESGTFSTNSFPVEAQVREQSDAVTRTLSGNGVVGSSSFWSASVPTDRLSQSTGITKRWSRQGVLPKQLTPPSGPPPSIPPSPENNYRTSMESGMSIPIIHAVDRSPSSSSSNLHPRTRIRPISSSSLSPTFWKRGSSSSAYSGNSINTSDSQGLSHMRSHFGECFPSSFGSVVSNGGSLRPMSLSVNRSSPVVHVGTTKRRSMPPPRPAPNFAPPPAPAVQESISASTSTPLTIPAPAPPKSFRSSVARRALRLSLTSPKPPPSSALPPRPDEITLVQSHRRSSSSGRSDTRPVSPSSRSVSSSRDSNPIQHASPSKSISIRQRLRILSTPPTHSSSSSIPSIQISTLDLSDDNDDDPSTPCFATPRPFGLGEHIMTIQNDPSFLQLSSPITPTTPKPPPHSPFRPSSPPPGPDCDFVALSPPPPRMSCRSHGARPEKYEMERSGSEMRDERKLVALSQRGSVVSLGFVTT